MRTHRYSFKSRKGGNVHALPSVCLFPCLPFSLQTVKLYQIKDFSKVLEFVGEFPCSNGPGI